MDDRITRKWIINCETVEVEFQPGARLLTSRDRKIRP